MITVILVNMMQETRIRRYDTNSFDEAAVALADDWIDGKIVWDWEDTNEKLNAEWMRKSGYPTQDCTPDFEDEVYILTWHYCGSSEIDDEIVIGHFIKSAPVKEGEGPTAGLA